MNNPRWIWIFESVVVPIFVAVLATVIASKLMEIDSTKPEAIQSPDLPALKPNAAGNTPNENGHY